MGRKKKENQDKKIKISISLDRGIYLLMKNNKLMPSRIIEKLLREYYGNKEVL